MDEFLKNGMSQIGDSYTALKEHNCFAIWALIVLHNDGDFSDSNIEEAYQQSYALLNEKGPGDQQLDGYYFDEQETCLYLYQAKWSQREDGSVGATEAKELSTAFRMLESDAMQGQGDFGDSRETAIDFLKVVMSSGGRVVLRGVTNTRWTLNSHSIAKKALGNTHSIDVSVELLGIDELKEHIGELKNDLGKEEVEFRTFGAFDESVLNYKGKAAAGFGKSLICLLSSESVGQAAKQYGVRLFDRNVRTYLGANHKRVNKGVIEALKSEEERARFWYGHNGITILCSEFSKSSESGINLVNPQIVNGCQTASSFAELLSDPQAMLSQVPVLARIIQLNGSDELIEEASGYVAYGTNNQSPISQSDLKANDPTQKYFEKALSEYKNGWFYERKKNGYQNLEKSKKAKFKDKPDRLIKREAYQQAWRAYSLQEPTEALLNKNHIWEAKAGAADSLYDKVFSKDRRPCDIVISAVLFDWFSKIFTFRSSGSLCIEFNKKLNKELYLNQISQAKGLVSIHAVALFGYLISKRFGSVEKAPIATIEAIISCLDRGAQVEKRWGEGRWKPLDREMKIIMNSIFEYVKHKNQTSTLYVSLKKSEAFNVLISTLDEELEVSPIEDLLNL